MVKRRYVYMMNPKAKKKDKLVKVAEKDIEKKENIGWFVVEGYFRNEIMFVYMIDNNNKQRPVAMHNIEKRERQGWTIMKGYFNKTSNVGYNKMKRLDGVIVDVPKEKVKEYKKKGYKNVLKNEFGFDEDEEMTDKDYVDFFIENIYSEDPRKGILKYAKIMYDGNVLYMIEDNPGVVEWFLKYETDIHDRANEDPKIMRKIKRYYEEMNK